MPSDYEQVLYEDLRNPEFAAAYIQDALEGADESDFLLAIRDVVRANGGMTALANGIARRREPLYRSLSDKGNPEFSTVRSILGFLGMKITVTPVTQDREPVEVRETGGAPDHAVSEPNG